MPKYKPTIEDIYPTKKCPVCGEYILDGAETCCELCAMAWQSFTEDYDWMMMKELEEWD